MIAAKCDLVAYRYVPFDDSIEIEGIDLSDHDAAMQVRLYRDAPGDPLISLSTTAGMSIDVDLAGTLPKSFIRMLADRATIDAIPFAGERGEDVTLAWDMVLTPPTGSEWRAFEGGFIVKGGATQ